MRIYFSHSKKIDFEKLYNAIRESDIYKKHEIIFPHEKSMDPSDFITKDVIKDCDLVIAEVSFPATGQGIELGWADANNKKIVCVYKKGAEISSSLKIVSDNFVEYEGVDEFIDKINNIANLWE